MTPSCSARWRAWRRSTVIPQTGSSRTMSSTTGLERDRLGDAAGDGRRAGRRRRSRRGRGGPGPARPGSTAAISSAVSAPRSMPAGARSAAIRSSPTVVSSRSQSRTTRGARRRRDQADVGRLAREREPDRLLVPDPLARDDDVRRRVGVEAADVGRAADRSAPGNASASAIGSMTVTRQPAADATRGERTGDRRRPDDPELRRGKMRFHVDLQRAPEWQVMTSR